ncbi:unnamed protein product [Soboliphyme baturini]|uniref:Nesprin-1-like n=1 Tax=Soboliphyme baturini TaxID=241478 RepID=A0A183IPL5_9BILA|nr:unnamed protein product [Soboliphyme baturini]
MSRNYEDNILLLCYVEQFLQELDGKSSTVEEAVCLGEQMVGSLADTDEVARDLQQQFLSTRQQWGSICKAMSDRLNVLMSAFELWKEFQELMAAEKIALDEMESKLKEPRKPAADAEDFSEQLDELERIIENCNRHDRIMEIATSLQSQRMMLAALENELTKYKVRRSEVLFPAYELHSYLKARACETEEHERQLNDCLSWIEHVDNILSARLESDTFASDLPEEYEKEISGLRAKFEHFSCVSNLDTKISRLKLVLEELKSALLTLDVSADDTIEHRKNTIDKLSEIEKKLQEVKPEVNELEFMKRRHRDSGDEPGVSDDRCAIAVELVRSFQRISKMVSRYLLL